MCVLQRAGPEGGERTAHGGQSQSSRRARRGVKLSNGSGSVVYVDNTVRQLLETGAVGPEKKDESVENLVEHVAADKRVDACVMQTVGNKDYDGFLLAIVK